jgi:hypothetical protein
METSTANAREPSVDTVKAAEAALARLGYTRVTAVPPAGPTFWVQEVDTPKRTIPVFLWDGPLDQPVSALNAWRQAAARTGRPGRAIVVVPSERAAEAALDRGARKEVVEAELAVLVVPKNPTPSQAPRWHALVLPRREVLDLATGIVVGLFRRAQAMEGSSEIDFQELLQVLRRQFRVDLHASLGVDSDEASLFMLYQLARKYGFAPGDPSANLHLLVLRPTGPAARLPWFAA